LDAVEPSPLLVWVETGDEERDWLGEAWVNVVGLKRLVVPRLAPRLVVFVETGPAAALELDTVDDALAAEPEEDVDVELELEALLEDVLPVVDAVSFDAEDVALVDPEDRGRVTAMVALPER
jgi:hypothetical protein